MWGDRYVLIVCHKQKFATKNSTKLEFVGLSYNKENIVWKQELILALGYEIKELMLFQDNTSTITIIKDNGGRWM